MMRRISITLLVLLPVGVFGWFGWRALPSLASPAAAALPFTAVKRGDVSFTISSKGELQGGHSKMLAAPMTGSREIILTSLRRPGEEVEEGAVVATFDTTEEAFKLREAEADLGEAQQQVVQAKMESQARDVELQYELIKARGDLRVADLETRRNPLLAAIVAKQNDMAKEGARDRLEKLERDYPQRKAAAAASIAIQEAAVKKATVQAETARRNIEMLTLKAPTAGYVSVERNTNTNFYFGGMQFPLFQPGDTVRAGMAVAQIPDLKTFEIGARVNEQDRGHLAVGQPVDIRVLALPSVKFEGKVSNLGGTVGRPWDRYVEIKVGVNNPSPDLRPGMSASLVVHTDALKGVLWIPAQALFESDNRTFVYRKQPDGWVPLDVKLVKRSESRVVLTGVKEGEFIALANPDQMRETAGKTDTKGGAMKALAK
ncbi:MAG: efflux RND transporter periplasmic adaptor subunit [Acidobacteriia bacterium]|nr:efflux RND transporter periplasmic adaptor subunit [Terriglobia bacterium]